jgi:hypothetical protein
MLALCIVHRRRDGISELNEQPHNFPCLYVVRTAMDCNEWMSVQQHTPKLNQKYVFAVVMLKAHGASGFVAKLGDFGLVRQLPTGSTTMQLAYDTKACTFHCERRATQSCMLKLLQQCVHIQRC